jgi:hypothetical protein
MRIAGTVYAFVDATGQESLLVTTKMPNSLTGFRIVTALLSLVAVVLSVLEHEDLLLPKKGTLRSGASPINLQTLGSPGAESSIALPGRASADGTCRKELQDIRVTPGSRRIPLRPSSRGVTPRRPFARLATRVLPRGRPRIVGVVELRL